MNFRKLALLLPIFALTLVLSGCGESKESAVLPTAPETPESYESDSYGDSSDESAN